jgi:raw score 9.87
LAGGSWNGEAQNELGILHFNGQGTPKDDAKAFLYFQLAAENGSPEGMYNLGAMYDNGFGTKRNRKFATQWFKKSCEAGYEKACEML